MCTHLAFLLCCYKDVVLFSSLRDWVFLFFFFSFSVLTKTVEGFGIVFCCPDIFCCVCAICSVGPGGTSIDSCLLAVTHIGWRPKSTTLGWCKRDKQLITSTIQSADGLIQLSIDVNKVLFRCWMKSQKHSYLFKKNRHTHLHTHIFTSGASVVLLSEGLVSCREQNLNTIDSCFKWYLAERLSSTLWDIGLSHERFYESLHGTSSLYHLTNRYFLPCYLYSLAKKVKTAHQTKPTRKPVQNACCKYFKRFRCEESRAVFLVLTHCAFLKIHPSFLQATINNSPTHLRMYFIQTFPRPT